MFTSTFNKGFQITFENGWTISVQFGSGNYCNNRDLKGHDMIEWKNRDGVTTSPNAEIAIWDSNNIDYKFDKYGLVKGWCTPDEVAEWISKVSKWTIQT